MCVVILKQLIRPHDATLIYAAYVKKPGNTNGCSIFSSLHLVYKGSVYSESNTHTNK